MIALIITLILLLLNHSLKTYLRHDAIAIDICIGIGYILYMFL